MKPNPDYIYPPDFEKAYRHRLAHRIFKGKLNQDDKCECCNRRVGQEQVQVECNIDPKELTFLGPGVPLFFLFLKIAIVMLLMLVIIFSIYCLTTNANSHSCQTNAKCNKGDFTLLSIVNKKDNITFLSIQSYLGLAYVVMIIVLFHYLRHQGRILEEECDEVVNSPSDYAIILRRLPPNVTERDITEMIETRKQQLEEEDLQQQQRRDANQIKVVKVVFSFSLRPLVQVRESNKRKWVESIENNNLESFKPEPLPVPRQTSQIAIVIFEKQTSKDFFVHQPTFLQSLAQFFCTACQPLCDLQIKGHKIGIQRAPEPDQIFWENSGITMKGSICRKVSYGLISILVLLIGGCVQYGLAVLNTKVTDGGTKMFFKIFNPLFVVLWSEVLMALIIALTEKERNQTVTEFQSVLVVKITLCQFLNAGIFVVGTKILASINTFDIGAGIAEDVTILMMINVIIPNSLVFLRSYFQIYNKMELYLVRKGWIIRSQLEVNKMSAGTIISMPKRYAYILKTLLLNALYAPVVPIVPILGLCGLIIFFFIQKLLFTRSYSMPHTISSMTFHISCELLEYFLITFSLGQFIVYAYFYAFSIGEIPTDWLVVIFVTLALALLNSALPMEFFNEKLFPVKQSERSQLTYHEVESSFDVTYQKMNPSYKVLFGQQGANNEKVKDKLIPVGQAKDVENLFGDFGGAIDQIVLTVENQNQKSFSPIKQVSMFEPTNRIREKNDMDKGLEIQIHPSRVKQPEGLQIVIHPKTHKEMTEEEKRQYMSKRTIQSVDTSKTIQTKSTQPHTFHQLGSFTSLANPPSDRSIEPPMNSKDIMRRK